MLTDGSSFIEKGEHKVSDKVVTLSETLENCYLLGLVLNWLN